MIRRCVLVGGGPASVAAVETLRERGFDGGITLVAGEPHLPYERPPLSKDYLTGRVERADVVLHPEGWYSDHDVDLRLGTPAAAIDPGGHTVTLATGERLGYDALVLATGARPRSLPGVAGDRVHVLRTLDDADRLRRQLDGAQHVVLLGAGFVGCEVAAAAVELGARATLFDPDPAPLARAVGPAVAAAVLGLHRDRGVEVRAGETPAAVTVEPGRVRIDCRDGDALDADLVVVGVGCSPQVALAAEAGLAVDDGIVVDEFSATGAPGVYAVGDVANRWLSRYRRRMRIEHHDTAQRAARRLAAGLAGEPEPFDEPPWFWSDQYEHTVQALGRLGDDADLVRRGAPEEVGFSLFAMRDGLVEGVVTLDRPRDVVDARALIEVGIRVDAEQIGDTSVRLKRLVPRAPKVVSS
ncbi:FAD-dependent oxidoreductase [Pseudonocardia sp. NPDC049635]|uniref:NAD(P)/FAD-dependent oxidoreductase n=1 Tax=Pseudonocardia sp. NPDC049635 TaxID=3155506 RepID=UPI0033CC737D